MRRFLVFLVVFSLTLLVGCRPKETTQLWSSVEAFEDSSRILYEFVADSAGNIWYGRAVIHFSEDNGWVAAQTDLIMGLCEVRGDSLLLSLGNKIPYLLRINEKTLEQIYPFPVELRKGWACVLTKNLQKSQ